MEFISPEETLAAMLVRAKWLPELVRRTEAGVMDRSPLLPPSRPPLRSHASLV